MKIIRNRFFRIAVLIICIGVIIYESIGLYNDSKEYEVADTEYETLTQDTISVATPEEIPEGATYPPMHINYGQLKGINKDFVCWLYFPYFDLSYPVVQENVIDEYLRKTFEGTYNTSGCLFTDILSTPDFTGMHDIIFGHNMRNGSMFGRFKELSASDDREIIKSNPYVYVYTEKAVYQYEIFGYYVTTVGSDAYSVVTTNEEYDKFLSYISRNSLYQRPDTIDFAEYPSILTLSTCSGKSGSGKRFVIHTAKVNSWELE